MILRIVYHEVFIFHMLIGLDGGVTTIDIELIRSKVKVRRITRKNMVSPHYLNYFSQSFHILHADWYWWRYNPYWHGVN